VKIGSLVKWTNFYSVEFISLVAKQHPLLPPNDGGRAYIVINSYGSESIIREFDVEVISEGR
jgi:hypothetical protein